MTTNQFIPFATQPASSDIIDPVSYQTYPGRTAGHIAGTPSDHALVNTEARQSSTMSTTLAQYVCDVANVDMLDTTPDENIPQKVTDLKTAIGNQVAPHLPIMQSEVPGPYVNGIGRPDNVNITVNQDGVFGLINQEVEKIQTTAIIYNPLGTTQSPFDGVNFSLQCPMNTPLVVPPANQFPWGTSTYTNNFLFEKGFSYNFYFYNLFIAVAFSSGYTPTLNYFKIETLNFNLENLDLTNMNINFSSSQTLGSYINSSLGFISNDQQSYSFDFACDLGNYIQRTYQASTSQIAGPLMNNIYHSPTTIKYLGESNSIIGGPGINTRLTYGIPKITYGNPNSYALYPFESNTPDSFIDTRFDTDANNSKKHRFCYLVLIEKIPLRGNHIKG